MILFQYSEYAFSLYASVHSELSSEFGRYIFQAFYSQNQNHQLNWWFAPALQGRNTDSAPEGALKGLATASYAPQSASR